MPTVLRVGPYRFFFYVGDRNEPPHVHVRRDKKEAKFWLILFALRSVSDSNPQKYGVSDALFRITNNSYWRRGMKNSDVETWNVFAEDVKVTNDLLTFKLSDGRVISAPLSWYPRLSHGTRKERNNWELGSGVGVYWPDLDEDISVENLLKGQPSGESKKSFQRWLDQRKMKAAG